jgi:hypothetical protein
MTWEALFWVVLVGVVLWPMRPGRGWRDTWEEKRRSARW